ncbi:MAG: hypothetical protein AAFR62_07090 [Cyanobacteria bacterium J06629_2]
MTYKSLLTTLLTSVCSLGALASIAVAQEPPECYIIDSSGELTDLTDICNVSQKRAANASAAPGEGLNIINNNNNITNSNPTPDSRSTVVAADSFVAESSLIDSSLFIDNELGNNYTAYTRRFNTAPTSVVRQTLREQSFQLDNSRDSLTSILRATQARLPFLIYRYPKQ